MARQVERSTALTLRVTRTAPRTLAPRTIGTAVASSSSSSVALVRRAWTARPRRAEAISGRSP